MKSLEGFLIEGLVTWQNEAEVSYITRRYPNAGTPYFSEQETPIHTDPITTFICDKCRRDKLQFTNLPHSHPMGTQIKF